MLDDSIGHSVTREDMGRFFSYLAEIKFVPRPIGRGRQLPHIKPEVLQGLAVSGMGGRGGTH